MARKNQKLKQNKIKKDLNILYFRCLNKEVKKRNLSKIKIDYLRYILQVERERVKKPI